MVKQWVYFILKSVYLFFVVSQNTSLTSNDVDGTAVVILYINDGAAVAEVDRRYVSVALDSGMPPRHWEGLNFSSPRLRTLAKALSPAILRLGGSTADWLVFDDASTHVNWTLLCTCFSEKAPPCGIMRSTVQLSKKTWDKLNQFAASAGMEVLMDFNLLLRERDTCQLNVTNIRRLLDYSHNMGYNQQLLFEIGNEPDLYPNEFGFRINGTQNARDVIKLRKLLSQPPYNQWYAKALLVGPDTAGGNIEYIKEYISTSRDYVNAVTWHHYSLHAETATVKQFLDPNVYDAFVTLSQRMREAVYPDLPVWLGETNTAWGAGEKGLTDTYVNGLLWLDKLGAAAKVNTQVVVRQVFYGYNYSLVDHQNNPLPDYWLMLLHKRLVGQRVLSATTSLPASSSKYIRVYAHCTADTGSYYAKGSVTYFVINPSKIDVRLWLGDQFSHAYVDEYIMTPEKDNLLSRQVYLNGKKLSMLSETQFPPLSPRHLAPMTPSTLPARSYAFYVIPKAASKICMQV